MKDFVKNVITPVTVQRQTLKIANAITVNVDKKKRIKLMNKIYLVLILLFTLSACSVGKKCTYTQDGTKLSSYVWFYNSGKPIDLDKNNCN